MKRILTTCVIIVAFFISFEKSVSAHATPVAYEPESSSVVLEPPDEIRILFTEHLEPAASTIEVFGPNGKLSRGDKAFLDADDPRVLIAPLLDKGKGNYTVSWKVVSADDGHFTKGAYLFRYGNEGDEVPVSLGSTQVQHLTTLPEASIVFLELVGQALLLGSVVALMFLYRPMRRLSFFTEYLKHNEDRLRIQFINLLFVGISLLIISSVSFLLLKTQALQQLQELSFTEAFRIFLVTESGTYTLFRIGIALVLSVCSVVFYRKILTSPANTFREFIVLALIALSVFAKAKVSHAAAAHFYPNIGVALMFIHVFFKVLWVGLLAAFLLFFITIKDGMFRLYGHLSLSRLLALVMLIGGVSGVYIVWLDLKSFENALSTQWGTRFLVIVLLAGVMLALRLMHQIYIERKEAVCIVRGDKTPATLREFLFTLGTTLPLEFIVGLVVLFMSAYISITTPPFVIEEFSFEQTTEREGTIITLRPHPHETKSFLITADPTDPGRSVNDMVVTFTNTDAGIGPVVGDITKRFSGGYSFPQDVLSPSGRWTVTITAQHTKGYDAVSSFTFRYPEDILDSKVNTEKRSFNGFTVVLLFLAFVIGVGSWLLYRISGKERKRIFPESLVTCARCLRMPCPTRYVLAGTAVLAVVVLVAAWSINETLIETRFQKKCEENKHFWEQSLPMKNGIVSSPNTVTGCTVDSGPHHFADFREFIFYLEQ